MKPRNYCSVLLLVILFVSVKSDRKVKAELNPGCQIPECKNEIILVHVKAEGKGDTLHHLWDFTGKPSLLLALTDKNASLSVNWKLFEMGQDGAVTFDPPPKYVYGVVIDQLVEFNDEDNTGEFNTTSSNISYVTTWDTKYFDWQFQNLTNGSGDTTLTIKSTEYLDKITSTKKNGTVSFVLSAYSGDEHSESLPHLLHSGNASQLDLTLEGLSTKYKSSRFGLRLIIASSDSPNNTLAVKQRKTMDDEHAPGVFTIAELVTPSAASGGCGGYLQWRPVVYTSSNRDMTSSTDSVQYGVVAPSDPIGAVTSTLLYSALYPKLANMLVVETYVTFGIAGDGFYRKNQYATWTMLVGYGHPPEEQFSMLVTLVLLIGLGLPAVLILSGTVCIVLRRLQRNKDDLFLSR